MKADRAQQSLRIELAIQGIDIPTNDSILMTLALHDVVLESMPSGRVSVEKMQSILREKGIRIGNDDPVLSLMVLNGIILRESIPKLSMMERIARGSLIKKLVVLLSLCGVIGFVFLLGFSSANFSRTLTFLIGIILGAVLGYTGYLAWRSQI